MLSPGSNAEEDFVEIESLNDETPQELVPAPAPAATNSFTVVTDTSPKLDKKYNANEEHTPLKREPYITILTKAEITKDSKQSTTALIAKKIQIKEKVWLKDPDVPLSKRHLLLYPSMKPKKLDRRQDQGSKKKLKLYTHTNAFGVTKLFHSTPSKKLEIEQKIEQESEKLLQNVSPRSNGSQR